MLLRRFDRRLLPTAKSICRGVASDLFAPSVAGVRLSAGVAADSLAKVTDLQVLPKRLKGFEPSTFCMASSRSAAPKMQKCLQIGVSGRVDRTLAFQELCADTGGLDNHGQ